MEYKGLVLDEFQEKAIKAIEQNKSVVVSAPTGSGKTLIADYIINRDVNKGIRVIYTAPIKALSNQKYKEFSKDYGEENVGLITGDVVKNSNALILIMTTEIYRNMVLIGDSSISNVSYVVFDEIHYINDFERGYVWEESVIFSKPQTRMLCLSATIPNAHEFASWISAIKQHDVEVVEHNIRPIPLEVSFYDSELGITSLKNLKSAFEIPDYHKALGNPRRKRNFVQPSHLDLAKEILDKTPCLFFTLSRHGCQKKAMELFRKNLFKPDAEITKFIRSKLGNSPSEINKLDSTAILRQTLPYGIGFHHAGLLPVMKEIVEELFSMGKIKFLYTTETFAVGVNMPAKSVCFESLRKFDGVNFRMMNSKEYFQISGRAGRRGIDKEGFVYIIISRRDFDYKKLKSITSSDTEPIRSQFRLSVNTVLNLIKLHTNEEIDEILCKSFHSFQKYGSKFMDAKGHIGHSSFIRIKKNLEKMGYIEKNALTAKGEFCSKIYSDELIIGEIFSTDFYRKLNEYQMLLLVACICYEGRESSTFNKIFPSKLSSQLSREISYEPFLRRERRFQNIETITSLIHLCYYGSSIFRIIENTNLLEGDIIRFFRQIVDKLGQIKAATNDMVLSGMMASLQQLLLKCLSEVDAV